MQTSFIPYLILDDYQSSIESGQLNNQILSAIEFGGDKQRKFAESWAIDQVYSYLGQYFDLDIELTPTKRFYINQKYFAGNRVVIDFPEWLPSTGEGEDRINYTKGVCVIKYSDEENKLGGIGFLCNTDNSDSEWIKENWTAIGNQYDIYYIKYPYPLFVLNIEESNGIHTRGFYNIGDKVCYKNHIYECTSPTAIISHSQSEQYYRTYDIPSPNIFPDEKNNRQWKDLGVYYFIGEPPFYKDESGSYDVGKINIGIGSQSFGGSAEDNGGITQQSQNPELVENIEETVWELGDNRNPALIQALVDLSIWRLCSRIAPQVVPDERSDNKNCSFQWMRDLVAGKQQTKIPRIQPIQLGDISWGSNIKNKNGY